MSDYFNLLFYSGNVCFLSLIRALVGSSSSSYSSSSSNPSGSSICVHLPLQHQSTSSSALVVMPKKLDVVEFVMYEQPSELGVLAVLYVEAEQPKASKESESKSKNLMLSPELRMELFSNSFQPLKEDNKCSDRAVDKYTCV